MNDQKRLNVLQRCRAFLLQAHEEIQKLCLNQSNMATIKKFSIFQVSASLTKPLEDGPGLDQLSAEIKSDLSSQWRNVQLEDWENGQVDRSTTDPVKYWTQVGCFQNECSNQPYKQIAEHCLGQLTIAHSTACVERIFSQVATTKTKIRNRMNTNTLEAILRIKTHLGNRNRCCHNMAVTEDMIKRFNKDIYESKECPQYVQESQLDSMLRLTYESELSEM